MITNNINYLQRVQEAVQDATKAHNGQRRKGKDVPYITHPLTVAMILANEQRSEEVVIAGIFHDVLEDTNMNYEDLHFHYGPKVANLVQEVTNVKTGYKATDDVVNLERLHKLSVEARYIKIADVKANVSEIIQDYQEVGEEVFERFNGGKEAVKKKYITMLDTLYQLSFDPILKDYQVKFYQICN